MKPRLYFQDGMWWCRGVHLVFSRLAGRAVSSLIEGNGMTPTEAYLDWAYG